MRLSDLLHDRTIRVPITSGDREEVIAELISACLKAGTLTDGNSAQQAVAQRERQRSTGIGHNIAIPHGRCPEVHGVAMALGITNEPIQWNAIDGLPVRIVALVVSHPSRTVEHIQSLGRVSRFLGDATTRSTLMDATASDVARMIRAEDD
jgi:mannitol/fructose-specific phosphotransferase system IIA component (Ntr-type)